MPFKYAEIDGKRYRVAATDKHVYTPDSSSILDRTGQPLKVGTKVAWGTSYRGGGGAVIGEITSIGFKLVGGTAYEVDENDELISDLVTGRDYRGREYQYGLNRSINSQVWTFSIVTKSLMLGRKGNQFSDPRDVVAIANQSFGESAAA
ncbi:hypothetical protein [Brucella sp. 10RB9213]|uniref:hypothetical protein n=1 Tax=Brucella sp. 10RB9213 TaxID=1844039 RepID=UPI0012AE2827|nr:hypothetical protein [Brucella sp. 10RB9213]MRN66384.1 hypothetical protein [Brucella sp. 10RB9213]